MSATFGEHASGEQPPAQAHNATTLTAVHGSATFEDAASVEKASAASVLALESDLIRSFEIATQSQATLLNIPQEIRNAIFEYVYCDNIEEVEEHEEYQQPNDSNPSGILWAIAPARIRLDQTSPPNKNALLTCRQIRMEMSKLQAAAYRDYWLSNRFTYDLGSWHTIFPSRLDMQHIHHYCLPVYDSFLLDLKFEKGKWIVQFLLLHGEAPDPSRIGLWLTLQVEMGLAVRYVLASFARTWNLLSPTLGQGLCSCILEDIFCDGDVQMLVEDFELAFGPWVVRAG